jgi:hypothetical protein
MRESWFIKTENSYIGWDLTEVKDLSEAHTWPNSKKVNHAKNILGCLYFGLEIGRYEPKEITNG